MSESTKPGDLIGVIAPDNADHAAELLGDARELADRIHGNRSQAQRTAALAAFKSGRLPVLVETDIAARGIDVEALGHVVNFDVPLAAEDYIHRIGRTGRAEATGEAFTFVSPQEQGEVAAIERAVGRKLPRASASFALVLGKIDDGINAVQQAPTQFLCGDSPEISHALQNNDPGRIDRRDRG